MNESQYQEFCLGEVLTITTGIMLSPSGMEGIYKILNFMTADELFTHQLPRAMRECRPYLLEQFPQLTNINADGITPENYTSRLNEWIVKYGDKFLVRKIISDNHKRIDPREELKQMMPEKPVIIVKNSHYGI